MFACLDVCVYFLCVFTAKMPYTQTSKTHTHLHSGGVKIDTELRFFTLNVNSRLICDFKRSTVKQTRKMHMDVCVYGPFWRSAPHKKCRNAPYTHTHIHTHFCFLVSRPQAVFHASLNLGKSTRTQGKECTFRNFRRPQHMGRGDPRWAPNPVLATPHARKYTPTLKTLVFKLKNT